jgi:DNA ligase D-like protein (predicted ligase)
MVTWGTPVRPMLARTANEAFDSPQWTFEVKWDGTRTICFHGDRTWFQNRRSKDITYRYPEVQVRVDHQAILDGEIVVLRDGLPNFRALQEREHVSDPRTIKDFSVAMPATYVVFDLLYLDGTDLTRTPLERRRELLDEVLSGTNVERCDHIRGRGRDFFDAVRSRGLEGIIAKRLSSLYYEGKRSRDWLKIKATRTIDALVCGLTQGTGSRRETFGALVLGVHGDVGLVYIGRVGTGFDEDVLKQMTEMAGELEGPCPFPTVPAAEPGGVRWLRPLLVCEVRYLEFTAEGALRAPSFIRLRPDKPPEECRLPSDAPDPIPDRRLPHRWGRRT